MNKKNLSPASFIGIRSTNTISFGSGEPDLPPPNEVYTVLPSDYTNFKYGSIQGQEDLRASLAKQYPNSTENSFIIIALLDNWKNRKQNSQIIMRQAIGKIVTVPQTVAFPISPQAIRVSNYSKPVQMVILGSSYEELERIQSDNSCCRNWGLLLR